MRRKPNSVVSDALQNVIVAFTENVVVHSGFLDLLFTTRSGKYKVGVRTQSMRLNGAMNRVTRWCKINRHQNVANQAKYLNAVLVGHYHYYGITGNFKSVAAFYRHVIRIWHRYLCRRSQRAYIRWEKYMRILERVKLSKPYLPHTVTTG